jgi:ELWxxDGT repeat protein
MRQALAAGLRCLLPVLSLCWPAPAALHGQAAPYLVKDAAPGVDATMGLGANQFLVLGGGNVVFATFNEVWGTDGTPAGTQRLAELPCQDCNGVVFVATLGAAAFFSNGVNGDGFLWRTDGTRAGTYPLATTGEQRFGVVGGHLFIGGCAQGACGLLRSDGTAAGTTLVTTVAASWIVAAGSELYFFGPAGAAGSLLGLWMSDGSAAGTHLVKDFDPAQTEVFVSTLTGVANRVVFIAQQGQGEQLWASDGTAAGTLPLTQFTAAIAFQNPFLKPAGDRAYFVADDGSHGTQVWRTDGTAAGTMRMTEVVAHNGVGYVEISQLEEVNGKVVFLAFGRGGIEPWATSGTPASTHPLCGGACRSTDSFSLVKAAGRIFFTSLNSGPSGPGTAALWVTDGTAAGTHEVRPICTSGCDVYSTPGLAGLPGAVYFASGLQVVAGRPAPPGAQLWASDGTAAGTRLVFRHAPPSLGGVFGNFTAQQLPFAQPLASLGTRLYFGAPDDGGGGQIWVSDGTPGGARQLTDAAVPNSSFPQSLVAAGNRLFFKATAPGGPLWQSDGTSTGTLPVPGVMPSYSNGVGAVTQLTAVGSMVFYLQGDNTGLIQLWRADGSAAGTLQLTAFPAGEFSPRLAATANGELFFGFRADSSTPGGPAGLWKSDGTTQGTAKVVDLPNGYGAPGALTAAGGDIYFTIVSDQGAIDVWQSDGTAAGTVRLQTTTPPYPPDGTFDPGFTALGSRVFFSWPYTVATLWATDGTAAGTVPVAAPPAGPVLPFDLTLMGGVLYMLDRGNELWRTDGSAAGTVKVSPQCCVNAPLVVSAGKLYFAVGAAGGPWLWSSDGTASGTVPVDGPAASLPLYFGPLAAAGGRVFFASDDGLHGIELWQTDGTAQGTRMVDDIAPGLLSSYPAGMTQAGNLLYFSADDGWSGTELWALPLDGGPACQPSDAWLCLLGSRFRVEAAWRDGQGRSGAGHAVALTADTGWFWFFGPDNVEVVLKVLDGRQLDGHVWVFYGALSDVEYELTVTDTQTGVTRRYDNPPGQLASVADTHAFGPMGAFSDPGHPGTGAAAWRRTAGGPRAATAAAGPGGATRTAAGPGSTPGSRRELVTDRAPSCQSSATILCLNGSRFAVEVSWQDFSGRQGTGTALPLTADTGTFWFFDAANVELVVKVLDGRALNGHFWVFYGALSDVAYTLRLTDTMTGAVKIYKNPAGQLASVADTSAF